MVTLILLPLVKNVQCVPVMYWLGILTEEIVTPAQEAHMVIKVREHGQRTPFISAIHRVLIIKTTGTLLKPTFNSIVLIMALECLTEK